jgi:ADP-ribose pyrophosphatase YjhB (NUDIX family)
VRGLKVEEGFIPDSLYGKIVKYMPIPSVEAIIVRDGKLLFLRRKNSPAKGQWWFPGGRIRRGESIEEALFREVKEETGLIVTKYRFVNVYSRVFPERHDITIVYLCECNEGEVRLNDEHLEFKFFEEIPKGIHPYLLKAIQDSGWKSLKDG